MKKSVTAAAVLVTAALSALIIAGCGSGPYSSGEAIPEGSSSLSVQQVLGQPGEYSGNAIVVEGYFGTGFCSSCFLVKDGAASLTVEGSRAVPTPPDSRLNERMRVFGELKTDGAPGQEVYLVALGVEFE